MIMRPSIVVSAFLAGVAAAAMADGPLPVSWNASLTPSTIAPGGEATLRIDARIDPEWHIYSLTQSSGGPLPTRIALSPGGMLQAAGDVIQSKFETRAEPVFHMDVQSFSDAATFTVPVRATSDAAPGPHEARVAITYQACNGRVCLLPAHPILTVKLTIDASRSSQPPQKSQGEKLPLNRGEPKIATATSKAERCTTDTKRSLEAFYVSLGASQYDDPDAYRQQLQCIPDVLQTHARRSGDDLYYAAILGLRHDSYEHKNDYASIAANDLDAFLASAGNSLHRESAIANLTVALANAGQLDRALQTFDSLVTKYRRRSATHEQWPDSTNIEFSGSTLLRALQNAGRRADVETVSRRLLGYAEERDKEMAWRTAATASTLFGALEDQTKDDAAAGARADLTRHFAEREKFTASAEMWLASRRITELEGAGKPAEALAVLTRNRDNYVKAGFDRIYEVDLARLNLYDHPAPPIEAAEWINSEPLSLEQLRGKVVVLDFWASWCMPCREGFAALLSLARKYAPQGLVVIGVTQDDGWILTSGGRRIGSHDKKLSWTEEVNLLREFARDFNLHIPVAVGRRPVDTNNPYADAPMHHDYGVNAFPKGIVIDRSGIVRYVGDPDNPRYVEAVEAAVSSPPNQHASRNQ